MFTIFNLFAVLLLVLANGFFVASEFSLVGVRRSRIVVLAETGDRRAIRLLNLVDNLNAYISATQLGITLSSLALGWIGEPAVARLLEAPLAGRVSDTLLHTISFAVAFTIITFLHIVLGELAPKTVALERAEKTALAIALPMQLFYKTFSYPIRVLDWAGTRTVRLFGLQASSEHGASYTQEELRQLIDASHRSGHIEPEEQQLINRVLDFTDAEVREAMIPRTEVVALSVTATLEETEHTFIESGFSRLPVYRERLDEIVGVLFMKELLPFIRSNNQKHNGVAAPIDAAPTPKQSIEEHIAEEHHDAKQFSVEALLHPPMFIPATARLGRVLTEMQAAQTHLAFVIDEHGGIEGILTLEDLLEEIVGEINDEYDEEVRQQVTREADGSYILAGMLAVRDANRHLNLSLPEDSDYTTIAGFLLAQAGNMLTASEVVEYDGARFTVEHVEGRRITSVRFTPPADSDDTMRLANDTARPDEQKAKEARG
ncbi:MAG: hemolysin family protein [Pyrinomonadaceae bacterium MAG19_C2-C3]|nr:hemolysin family protein [Pyrinomonadaceae bacterium MAG19_C2-C3]